jgi:hypothetical protein
MLRGPEQIPADLVRFLYWVVNGDPRQSLAARLRGIQQVACRLNKKYEIDWRFGQLNYRRPPKKR